MNDREGEKSNKLIESNFDFPLSLLTGATHLESWASFLLSLCLKAGRYSQYRVSELPSAFHIPTAPPDLQVTVLKATCLHIIRANPARECTCCCHSHCHLYERRSISTLGSWLHVKLPQGPGFLFVLITAPWPWDSYSYPKEVIMECSGLNFCALLKCLGWSPHPHVVVFGNAEFKRFWGLDEVMRVEPP